MVPLLTLAWLTTVAATLAHGGEPAMSVEPATQEAGGTVEIVGDDFAKSESVDLALVGAGLRLSLGSVGAGNDGHFTIDVNLPSDVEAGSYVLEAQGAEGSLAAAPISVTASPAASTSNPSASVEPTPAGQPSLPRSIAPSPAGPESSPVASSDGMATLAVIALAVIAGVAGGLVLARRGGPGG